MTRAGYWLALSSVFMAGMFVACCLLLSNAAATVGA